MTRWIAHELSYTALEGAMMNTALERVSRLFDGLDLL